MYLISFLFPLHLIRLSKIHSLFSWIPFTIYIWNASKIHSTTLITSILACFPFSSTYITFSLINYPKTHKATSYMSNKHFQDKPYTKYSLLIGQNSAITSITKSVPKFIFLTKQFYLPNSKIHNLSILYPKLMKLGK